MFESIIEKVGTPTYVYDINVLLDRINFLKNSFNSSYSLVYAVKANTFIVKEIENVIDKYEICSPGEFEVCNKLDIDRSKMVISGVYKDRNTIENMISNYSDIGRYTIESLEHYKLLKELTEKYNRNINVLIRLTSGNQFGVSEEDFKTILRDKNELISIDGIEYFSGTQKQSIKKINKEIDYLIEFINEVEFEYNITLKEVEYGPGLPVFYFQDTDFDEVEFLKEVNDALSKIQGKKVLLELGRSISASCGYYLTKVVDMKTNKNGNHVILDGGINHIVYYGQTMAMRIPYFDVYPKKDGEIKNYNLYGSLCTVNDVLVKNISVNTLELGDVFVFKNVGAYSATEGISLFLTRDLPKVVLYTTDKEIKVVRDIVKTSDINYPSYK